MKIRQGFVSNSSSSSFYIKGAIEEDLLVKAHKSLGRDILTAKGAGLSVKEVALKFFESLIGDSFDMVVFRPEILSDERKEEYNAILNAPDDIKLIMFDSYEYCRFFYYEDNIVADITRNVDTSLVKDEFKSNYICEIEDEGWPYDFEPESVYSESEILNLIKDM